MYFTQTELYPDYSNVNLWNLPETASKGTFEGVYMLKETNRQVCTGAFVDLLRELGLARKERILDVRNVLGFC